MRTRRPVGRSRGTRRRQSPRSTCVAVGAAEPVHGVAVAHFVKQRSHGRVEKGGVVVPSF